MALSEHLAVKGEGSLYAAEVLPHHPCRQNACTLSPLHLPFPPTHLVIRKLRVSYAYLRPFEEVEKESHPTRANLGF